MNDNKYEEGVTFFMKSIEILEDLHQTLAFNDLNSELKTKKNIYHLCNFMSMTCFFYSLLYR